MVAVVTARSIMLSWDQPSLEEQNGILTVYHVIIMETQILYFDNGTMISQAGMNFTRTYDVLEGRTQLIDMLQPSNNYTVRIAAATAAGTGPFSDPITVMTFEGIVLGSLAQLTNINVYITFIVLVKECQ